MAYDKGKYGGLPDAYGRTGASQSLTPGEVQRLRQQLRQNPTGTVNLPQLTASVNDFPLAPGIPLFRASTDGGNFAITGFAGGTPGRFVVVCNVAGGQISLTDQSAGSAAGNRIITTSGVADVLTVGDSAIMIYDGVSQRWRVLVRTA